jgi:hypothetical protein
MHIGCIIWQSASNLMPYDMHYNKFSFGIHRPYHNEYARNSLYPYHPPSKVITSSQYMPTLFIYNVKYDNLQAIWWGTGLFWVHSMSESADLKTGCKELLLMISYTPKVIGIITDRPMPCIEDAWYDNQQAIWCIMRCFWVHSVLFLCSVDEELPIPVSLPTL